MNRITKEKVIEKIKNVCGDKYDYSLVEYKNSRTKIKIICPEHGIFEQKANNHLNGQGCFKCKLKKQAEEQLFTTEDFIQKAKKIHGDKYDYSLVNYNGIRTKIKIICPEHGIFEQTAFDHLANCGCKVCKDSRGERKIFIFLKNKKIIFETQKTFSNLKDINPLSYDFYLPNYNLLIEYNGIQHYKAINYFGGYKRFLIQKHHDWLKRKYAKKNGIKLLTISYLEFDNIDKILKENLSGC